ncbi:MAG TPA: glycosyltransferase family 2 protein [Fimbriimonadaceae bacterium]|nr:glycosyltransferase family 2 protein [Fimbriimonadaceae bacterium]
MTFSIISVCYNAQPDDITKTFESLYSQTGVEYEHIVIDGASKPDTLNAIGKYRHRIAHFMSEPDAGLYDAMNKGLKLATNGMVHFLNIADTFVDTTALTQVADCATGSDIVYCNLYQPPRGVTVYPESMTPAWLYNEGICQQALFARRELFNRIGDLSLDYKIVSDNDWIFRAIKSGARLTRLDRVLLEVPLDGFSSNEELSKFERYRLKKTHFSPTQRFALETASVIRRIKWRLTHRHFSLSRTTKH